MEITREGSRVKRAVADTEQSRQLPTIRELIEEKAQRGRQRRKAERLDTTRETVALSDNSPQNGGGSHCQPASQTIPPATGLRQDFERLIPQKPYCSDALGDGLQIRSKSSALKKLHIQLNGPSTFTWMIHDIDHPGAYFAHRDANLPPPNIVMINPENGHAHSAYLLELPVARHSMARLKPLRFFAACERGVARRLEADRHYAGLIAKNPTHGKWRTEWRRDAPYSLHEIESHLFERDMRPDPAIEQTFGAGRNVTVFDQLRAIAYREVREFKKRGDFELWHDRCVKLAVALNMQFPRAMKLSEVRAIAKSVSRWTWKHFSVERFRIRQSYLGKRGLAARWAGHVKAQPWKTMGISKATYYRRKSDGRL